MASTSIRLMAVWPQAHLNLSYKWRGERKLYLGVIISDELKNETILFDQGIGPRTFHPSDLIVEGITPEIWAPRSTLAVNPYLQPHVNVQHYGGFNGPCDILFPLFIF